MPEYHAWTATGRVAGLQVWSEPAAAGRRPRRRSARQLKGVERQRFFLTQDDGHEIEINLADAGIGFRDGQRVTVVWTARRQDRYGYCVCIVNRDTGQMVRLKQNLPLIRGETGWWIAAAFGLLTSLPAMIAMFAWLFVPDERGDLNTGMLLLSTVATSTVLFFVGFVVARLVLDYRVKESDRKIWNAAGEALTKAY